MKTKEFIEKVEAMGYKIYENEYKLYVSDDGERTLLTVSKCHQFKTGLDYPDQLTSELFNLAVEYAKTPISKRSAKYRIKIKGLTLSNGKGSYINFDPVSGRYFISNLNNFFKNKFTEDEIYELVNDPGFFLQFGSYETEEDD